MRELYKIDGRQKLRNVSGYLATRYSHSV